MLELSLILSAIILFGLISFLDYQKTLSLLPAITPLYLIQLNFIFPTNLFEILSFTFILIFIITNYKNLTQKISVSKYHIIPASALLIGIISTLHAPDLLPALGLFRAHLLLPVIFFFIYYHFYDTKYLPLLKKYLYISALALTIIAILQVITGWGLPTPWDYERRATSIFPFPNALGLFLSPIAILAIFDLFQFKKPKYLIIPVVIILGIILARTDSALAGIFLATITTLLISNFSKSTKIYTLLAFLITTATALFITPIRNKILFQEFSGSVRLSQWSETWLMLQDHPIFGAGLGAYPQVFAPYHHDIHFEIFQYPHQLFFNFWSEFGLLGLIFLISLIVLLLVKATNSNNYHQLSFFAIFALMFFHGLVDVTFFKNDLAFISWIFLALFIIFTQQSQNLNTKTLT